MAGACCFTGRSCICSIINFFGSSDLIGGEGAALVGGVAVILLLLATGVFGKRNALDYVGNHITNGFVFAFRAMGPVIPIAGFFFLGSAEFSKDILLVEEAPSFFYLKLLPLSSLFFQKVRSLLLLVYC